MQSWMLRLTIMAAVCGSLAAAAAAGPAAAQAIYSGGATFPSKVYRQLFDCWGVPADGGAAKSGPGAIAISPACALPTGDVSTLLAQILYAPVGSTAGKRALVNHDGSNGAAGLGTPGLANTIPVTSTALPHYGYPALHFASSDDPLGAPDLAAYKAAGGPAKYGAVLQIPTLVGAVAIAFNSRDGAGRLLNSVNAVPYERGGTSGLDLSRRALCGIFSGHITRWDNPILTALNGGVALGSGPITVVHRHDGSGTTFLLTQALVAQCAGEFGPTSEADATLARYEFAWSDNNVAAAQCPAIPFRATARANWPDLLVDQCAAAIGNPGGGTFLGAGASAADPEGDDGVAKLLAATDGAIGYVSPAVVAPVVWFGLKTANLQNQFDIDHGTGLFHPPTAAGAAIAMASAAPSFDAATIANPLNWSTQGVVANPLLPNAYPIAGFSWFLLYQCYRPADGTLNPILSYLMFHFTDKRARDILAANGFAPIADAWLNQVEALITASPAAMDNAGSGTCAAVRPGA